MANESVTEKTSKLEQTIKAHLDTRAEQLDNQTRAKLAEIRRKALNQPAKTGFMQKWFSIHFVPAIATSFCAVLIVSVMLLRPPESLQGNGTDAFTLAELASDPEELDAITDPGFYAWMDEVEVQKGKNGAV
jgi:hypothetical protein